MDVKCVIAIEICHRFSWCQSAWSQPDVPDRPKAEVFDYSTTTTTPHIQVVEMINKNIPCTVTSMLPVNCIVNCCWLSK